MENRALSRRLLSEKIRVCNEALKRNGTSGTHDLYNQSVALRVRSFRRIRIRRSDPRLIWSWRTKGRGLLFVGSVTMTIDAKSVKTTTTYGKIAKGRHNKRVKPVITSQAMLQNKRCQFEGCVHECSGVIRQFGGKTETKFCTTHSNICISLVLSLNNRQKQV